MAKSYFYKEIVSSAFMVAGQAVPWTGIGQDSGYIELDDEADAPLVAALNAFNGRAGIVKMSEEELNAKKKQIQSVPFVSDSRSQLLKPTPMLPAKRPAAEANAAVLNGTTAQTAPTPLRQAGPAADDLGALLEANAASAPKQAPFVPKTRKSKAAKPVEAPA